ncbi:transaldolase [Kiloniella laminariae]|uniref:transaldolase n=1 Tax=Kiloniella laminariae TaxID=454162 RepID=UPI0003692DC8|nr:transaldolase [Kiloniella laminariae]
MKGYKNTKPFGDFCVLVGALVIPKDTGEIFCFYFQTKGRVMSILLYLDSANLDEIRGAAKDETIGGITTNPTLMRKSGISNYEEFARKALEIIPNKPVSFEVFSDDFDAMKREARIIASWGENAFVKIPVSTTGGELTFPLIQELSSEGLQLNITAVFTLDQVRGVSRVLSKTTPAIISIFSGRLADSGQDPEVIFQKSVDICRDQKNVKLLWASTREIFNIVQAERSGADIITVTADLLGKRELWGKDPDEFCRETVQMFYNDALATGYKIG